MRAPVTLMKQDGQKKAIHSAVEPAATSWETFWPNGLDHQTVSGGKCKRTVKHRANGAKLLYFIL